MYKSKLQEICQQKLWSLPTYSSTRASGLDHCPQFRASVFVNGVSFYSSDLCKSSKEAQNLAAKLAFEHFNQLTDLLPINPSSPSSVGGSSISSTETMAVEKEIMSSYGNSPAFTNGRKFAEGSPHAPRFKATVTIDGRTFESQEFFHTLKEAEHATAKAALSSLSTNGIQEDNCALFKNLLQELAVKEGFSNPVYTTTKSGASHVPTFTSSVEVEGDVFHGVESKTKKQAELNAAKVAYISLKERYKSRIPAKSGEDEVFGFIYPNSSSSQPDITEDFQLNLEGQSSKNPLRNEAHEGIEEDNCVLFKSLLQELAIKEGFSNPVYTSTKSGASHDPTFTSSVEVEGDVFHGVESKTKKQAELNAAKVAYISLKERYKSRILARSGEDEVFEFIYPNSSSSQPNITEDFQLKLNLEGQCNKKPLRNEAHEGIQEDNCVLFKNLLQELAIKEGFSIPVYTTTKSGASHDPTFTSSVEVEGDVFHGVESKTKKQAELNAAKVAYISLKERYKSRIPARSGEDEGFEFIYPNSSSSQLNITEDFQLKLNLEGQSSKNPLRNKAHEGIEIIYPDSSVSNSSIIIDSEQKLNLKDKDEDVVDSSAEIITKIAAEIITKIAEVKAERHPTTLGSSSQDGSSSPTTVLECLERAVTEQNADQKTKTDCTLLCNRVLVYPRKSDLNLPKGVTMLPISDDQWVAVSVDYPDLSDD